MKKYEDIKRKEQEFEVGELVYLHLQPYHQIVVAHQNGLKLTTRYFSPYKVLQRVGAIAYTFDLPILHGSSQHFMYLSSTGRLD